MGHAFYMNRAFTDRIGIVEDADQMLADLDFDTFVGTGISGTLVAPLLADMSKGNRNFMIVRKQGQPFTHSDYLVEGDFGKGNRFVFVDDTIDSSATLLRVLESIDSAHKSNLGDDHPVMVGAFFYEFDYNRAKFFTCADLIDYIGDRTRHYKRNVGNECRKFLKEFM